MWSWFKKESKPLLSLADIAVDMHCHVLPGIDDGARTLDESIAMINKMVDLGYHKIIATPHIMHEVYPNTAESIQRKLVELQAEISRLNIPVQLDAAAEYYLDLTLMESIKRRELLTFGNQMVLVEFGFLARPDGENELFFELQANGYRPVLAHVERYGFLKNSLNEINDLRNKGILMQLNLLSLTGHYGSEVKKQAERLLEAECIDFVASDSHRMQHLQIIEQHISSKSIQNLLQLSLKNRELLMD